MVNVVDVNDEIPQFGQASYEESLPELSAVGMSVLGVTATDGDQPGVRPLYSYSVGFNTCQPFNQSTV